MLQSAHGGGGDDWQTPTLQNLKRSSPALASGYSEGGPEARILSYFHSPSEAGNQYDGDTRSPDWVALGSPDLTFLLSHRPRPPALPLPPARARPRSGTASRARLPRLPITAFCSSLVTETTVLGRLGHAPLELLPAFRALRPITSVRVFFGSRLPAPALLETPSFFFWTTESPDLQSLPRWKAGRGVCVKRRGARRKRRGCREWGGEKACQSDLARRTEACGSLWPLKCDSALSSGASL